jgi:hypothetical protein
LLNTKSLFFVSLFLLLLSFQNFTFLAQSPSKTGYQPNDIGVVYGETISFPNTEIGDQSGNLHSQFKATLASLGANSESAFPTVVVRKGHTLVSFSQLLSSDHGGGSVAAVAIRERGKTQWKWFTFFATSADPNDGSKSIINASAVNPSLIDFLNTNDLLNEPIEFREWIVSKHPLTGVISTDVMRSETNGPLLWGPVIYDSQEERFIRTGYDSKSWQAWLLEANSRTDVWKKRSPSNSSSSSCGPIATPSSFTTNPSFAFSEAAVSRITNNRWVAIVREDSGRDGTKQTRRLFQVESFDNGCTWSHPSRIGDGTQPHLLSVVMSEGIDHRLVMCVGDRTVLVLRPFNFCRFCT